MGKLFGGQYSRRQAFSGKSILEMDETEVIPEGRWYIVVIRPSEAILFREATVVDVEVTVY